MKRYIPYDVFTKYGMHDMSLLLDFRAAVDVRPVVIYRASATTCYSIQAVRRQSKNLNNALNCLSLSELTWRRIVRVVQSVARLA